MGSWSCHVSSLGPRSRLWKELSASAAIRKVQRFGSHRDNSRTLARNESLQLPLLLVATFLVHRGAGFSGSWAAMRAVLEVKFSAESHCASALLSTDEAFLLDTGGVACFRGQWGHGYSVICEPCPPRMKTTSGRCSDHCDRQLCS